MDEKDSIIVLSGGMDSVTLLYEFRANIALAVTFDYGSNHNRREIEFARMHCERLGIEHIVIPLDFMAKYFKSSLLEGAEAIPEGNYDDENMKSTVVPFRNGIMLAVACGLAESRGLSHVMIANHAGDHAIYPDCRPATLSPDNIFIALKTEINYSSYSVGSSIPASWSASMRSRHVPHLPQCFSPPL